MDGFDETIMPMDYKKKGHIIDDDVFAYLVAPLKSGVRLTCLMDCCHSGSAMDLPFIWNGSKRKWDREWKPKFAAGDVQLFSGCADEESSADFYIPQQEKGSLVNAQSRPIRVNLQVEP
ncbi:metacaspase-3-like [Condylostylus longicornis]|uniref:metacaspase-3-like n=1 Tax=Condylostylus longicornis TaxID=2530218 RepID=UPI00244E1DA5|nr:metacaspase-3-like [Condylostylus longicornis]